jgi:hypothetical protein
VKEKRPGESRNNASDTHNTSSRTTKPAGKTVFPKDGSEAVVEARKRQEQQTGSRGSKGSRSSAGAGAL